MGLFGKKFKCQTCGAKFDSEAKLHEHAEIHAQEAAKSFKCATCGAAFTSEAELDKHTRDAHMEIGQSETASKVP
jgi:DNA-directed RNA polymerase subunit RPC12/RpoP